MLKNPFHRTMPVPPLPLPPPTLKERVHSFWEWYRGAAARFAAMLEGRQGAALQTEVAAKVDALLPGMAWAFGPGAESGGHSFTLTPEGNADRRFIAAYWRQQAPALEKWTFHASRQPSELHRRDHCIEMGGLKFAADAIWLVPRVNESLCRVDLAVWHPLFDRIPAPVQENVTLLWLEEMLGEDAVSNWIGDTTAGDRLTEAMPLTELPEYLAELQSRRGWKKPPPHQSYCLYRMPESSPHSAMLRGDIVGGNSCHIDLVRSYPLATNPLEAFGAEYMMLAFPTSLLPRGVEVDHRGLLEDALSAALVAEASGTVLGGALGTKYTYIDLLLYDAENSRRLVRKVMAGTYTAATFRLLPFVDR
jgi:hypothetical protein